MLKFLIKALLRDRRNYSSPIQVSFNFRGNSYVVVGGGLYLVEWGNYSTMDSPSNFTYQFVMQL